MTETNTRRSAEPVDSSQSDTDASTNPPIAPLAIPTREPTATTASQVVFDLRDVDVYYGPTLAVEGVTMQVYKNVITAMIGPSGCGKSTMVRTLNRMNDSIPGFRVTGEALYHGNNLYDGDVDPVEVRRRIGMVFQRPNPFPKSIFDNIAWAPRILGLKSELEERVEKALRGAALWDEVKDRLKSSALGLSGGQQQRLCIARSIAIEPDVLLLDEPCSALDPIATASVEDLMQDLKRNYTLVIVTHNMQQAARVAERTAFFSLDVTDGKRTGVLVEYDETEKLFTRPDDTRTEDYVTGRFG
jgi:phosphate transport system ATP-binding protein